MQSNRNEVDFSSIMASSVHDMKNSIAMLLGTLDDVIINSDPNSGQIYEKLMCLQYEGTRVNINLIQLLALYRMSNEQYFTNVNEHAVCDFLEDIVISYEKLLNYKNINIEIDCDDQLMGFFDKELVAGVINNVINNCYKYSKDRIRLSSGLKDGYLYFSIEDNGNGYPDAMLNGYQQPNEINFSTGSTGLGLYFSTMIAASHKNENKKGYIEISNQGLDGGGKFILFLP